MRASDLSTAVDIPGLALMTGSALGCGMGPDAWEQRRLEQRRGHRRPGGQALRSPAAFMAWELRAREPMVPMRFFRSRAFASGISASFFFYAAIYGVVFFLPQFLQTAQGHGAFGAGLRLLPWTATLFVVAPVAGASSIGWASARSSSPG